MVRFRGQRILGQFPKHLSQMLGPLLQENLIQVEAQALMEERFLPIGADVAFAISYVPLLMKVLRSVLHVLFLTDWSLFVFFLWLQNLPARSALIFGITRSLY